MRGGVDGVATVFHDRNTDLNSRLARALKLNCSYHTTGLVCVYKWLWVEVSGYVSCKSLVWQLYLLPGILSGSQRAVCLFCFPD